ncbi:transposase, partial [Xanthomonas hortorum pv. hederae]|uniref:transposase n=1 Tax=Xanthomonas hortorum TaxID=56454 RepID=UPI001F42D563
ARVGLFDKPDDLLGAESALLHVRPLGFTDFIASAGTAQWGQVSKAAFFIAARPSTTQAIGNNRERAREQRWEHFKASVRAKVEHPFRVIKRQFGYTKVRYRGLAKNTTQVLTLFALSNLWMKRKQLLPAMGSVRL